MTGPGDVAPEFLDRLRPICTALPEAIELPAWIGIRWRIRTKTFAHVYEIDPEKHLDYARAVGADEPFSVLTFRSEGDELHALVSSGYPFFRLPWGANVVGMVLGERSDWDEVAELVTDSYRIQAPKRLAAQVRPPWTAPR